MVYLRVFSRASNYYRNNIGNLIDDNMRKFGYNITIFLNFHPDLTGRGGETLEGKDNIYVA